MTLKQRFLIAQMVLLWLLLQSASPATAQTLDYFYDPTFTPPNVVGGYDGTASSILVHDDGRYMVAGSFEFNHPYQIKKFVRFHNDGAIDDSFSTFANPMIASLLQFFQDGYLVRGTTGMTKMNMDGSLPGFPMSYLNHPFKPASPPFPEYRMYAVTDDDMIVQVGRFYPDSNNLSERRFLVRVYPDGSPDHSFEPLQTDAPPDGRVSSLFPTPDGKWMIRGTFNHVEGFETPSIARLNPDFSVDTTFKSPFPDHTWSAHILKGSHPTGISGAIDQQNRVYILRIEPGMAPLSSRMKHMRLLSDGSIDSTFQINGLLRYSLSYNITKGVVNVMDFEPDGTLIVGGNFRKIEGHNRGGIAKLNEDGSLIENVFHRQGADTAMWTNGTHDQPTITTFARLDDGRLMVGGRFSRYDGHDQWGVVRLVPSPVGVEEYDGNSALKVFPNPTHDVLWIDMPEEPAHEVWSLHVFDLSGALVLQESSRGSTTVQLSLASLQNGMYVLQVSNGNKRYSQRIVKH